MGRTYAVVNRLEDLVVEEAAGVSIADGNGLRQVQARNGVLRVGDVGDKECCTLSTNRSVRLITTTIIGEVAGDALARGLATKAHGLT